MKILIKKLNGTILDSSNLTEKEIESLSFATKMVLYGWKQGGYRQTEYPRQTKLKEFMEI